MKTAFTAAAFAALLAAPAPCFALWDVVTLTSEQAKERGMEVRSTAAGPNHVGVALEFKIDGKLKDFQGVTLRLGGGDNLTLSVPLREDRSKPGKVAVNFTADRNQLDLLTFEIRVPYRDGGLGGVVYRLHVKDFVEMKKAR